MSCIIQNNNHFTLGDITGTFDKLPVGNYSLQYSESTGSYYLVKQEDFKLPKKIYGEFSFIDRWVKSYHNNSEKNLGIMLSGVKGTGKTIAAQIFCVRMGLPVIFITKGYSGPAFESFLSDPCFTNCVLFVDEFEKVYNRYDDADSSSLLSLMDGMFNTKFVFLLTANDPSSINNKLQNRLNRIKYHKIYEKLDKLTIEEVVTDLLKHEHHLESLNKFINTFNMMTMDVLTSIIKEINLFDEDAMTCASYLNLTEEMEYYNISVHYKDKDYKCDGQYLNVKTDYVYVQYDHEVPEELTKILPDYASLLIVNYNYTVNNGLYIVQYSDDVTIKLYRKVYSLAF